MYMYMYAYSTDLVSSEVNVPQLSTALNIAYGINDVVVKNESLELATGREPLYGNCMGGRERGKKYVMYIYILV